MSIPTVRSLRAQARRLDRRLRNVEAAMRAMRAGNALHLQYANGTAIWSLTDGTRIDATVAAMVVGRPGVVDVGDALQIGGAKSQTYRYAQS